MTDSDNIDALLLHNILRTHNFLNPHLDNRLKELQLTCVQFNALLLLYETPNHALTLGEIGERLVVSRPNVTGLIDRLEKKGFVAREQGEDRRVIHARLAPQGEELVVQTLPTHREILGHLVDMLTPDDKSTLIHLLTKLRKGLRQKVHQGFLDDSRLARRSNLSTTLHS